MNSEQSSSIPVEKGWPILGVLPNFLGKQDPFEYLKNIMLEHGDLVQLNFGIQPVYLVSHPTYLQRILRDNYQNYCKPDMFYHGMRVIGGQGLVTSEGKLWLRQKRMIQPHLHRKELANILAKMSDAISEVLNHWTVFAENGTQVDLQERMSEITMNVITRTMFGDDTLPKTEIAEVSQRTVRMVKFIANTFYSGLLPKWVPLPGQQQLNRDLSAMRGTINQIIEKCRQNKESSAGLIRMLLDAVDEESHEQMTEQQLFDEVITLFFAGYETTATALTWFGVVSQEHPDVLEKLRAEVDQVLGDRMPTFEDIPRLIYTRQVFMETLRMHTVAPFLPRTLNTADQLGNYHLPANAMVLIFYHGVHHNPRVWDQPEVFDPERFTPERMAEQPAFSYIPFSAGPHKCIGDEFAMFEGTLIMAMVLQKYNLNIIPNQIFDAQIGATSRPRNGVKLILSNRTSIL